MSRWDRWGGRSDWGWDAPAPKKPPPAHGIKLKNTGATWWGQRWIEALERMSADYAGRLSRGRAYARAGRTHDLAVLPGRVTAKVTGSAPRPYKVEIRMATLPDAAWTEAIAAMAAKAQFSAELLAGEMPRAIDEAFRAAGTSLFPDRGADRVTSCSCPDWANPCKHVAATHYILGEAIDKDPFLLFALRGRTREQVLAALRVARGNENERPVDKRRVMAAAAAIGPAMDGNAAIGEPAPAVRLGKVSDEAYDAWRGSAPALHLSLERPLVSGALLRQLGAPPPWSVGVSPAELLVPLVRAASEHALAMALGGDEQEEPDGRARSERAPVPQDPAIRRNGD